MEQNKLTEEEEDALLERHRREKKELKERMERLKHSVPKTEKKGKKEVSLQIQEMEKDLNDRQDREWILFNGRQKSADKVVANCAKSLERLEMEREEESVTSGGIVYHNLKVSKAQKKRERKTQKEKERQERIAEEELEGDVNRSRSIEADKFAVLVKERGVTIFEIPSDGDCMYRAIQHQLRLQGIEETVDTLRAKTAAFMRQHPHEFLPFLVDDKTGDIMDEKQFNEYCDSIEKTKTWGGQIELQALSDCLETPIEVVQVDSPPVIIGENKTRNKKLLLSYHRHAYQLGEHYNSLSPKSWHLI